MDQKIDWKNLDKLYETYSSSGCPRRLETQLINACSPLLSFNATRAMEEIPNHVLSFADLTQIGAMALIEGMRNYDRKSPLAEFLQITVYQAMCEAINQEPSQRVEAEAVYSGPSIGSLEYVMTIAVATLSPREEVVIRGLYGINRDGEVRDKEALADDLNLEQAAIATLERKGIEKLMRCVPLAVLNAFRI